jgi:choline-sulfatase
MRPPRALAARGALLGAIGGITAGLSDFAQTLTRAGAFMPAGKWKLALFLATLYGAAGSVALALVGLVLGAIVWCSDGGKIWRAAFAGEESAGARVGAYVLAAAAMLVGVGLLVDPIALDALRFYHHRLLIAGLVAAGTAGVFFAGILLTLVLAALLSPLVRFGPRAKLRFRVPAGLEAGAWFLGLYAGAGGVAALLFALEAQRRLPPAAKAHTLALWAPGIMLVCLLGAHFIARQLPLRERALATPRGALVSLALATTLPLLLVIAVEWPLVRQLDLRPFLALAVAFFVVVAALSTDAGDPLRRRPIWLRGLIAVAVPVVLLTMALGLGRSDQVRKAASSFTGASGPIIGVLQRATDFDGDGYSSILGGGDCDDFDRDVHPGALDWPDDGIDQDCNGHSATLTTPAAAPWATPPALPPDVNVVLITIDALRSDHVGAYGYPRATTPRLDALARESTRFGDAWAHAPSTRYSIPAILSGRYPSTIATGLAHWPPNVLPENRMLAEMMKDRGYHTAAFMSYYYFETGWGLNQGFDEYDYHLQTLHSGPGVDPSRTSGTSSRQLADELVDWIGQHHEKSRGQKFFLWTHFYDTHFGFERHPDMPESNFGDSEIDLYDGEIRFTDFHIGRVLDALKMAGLWDKTIVIVTSDHGDGFGEHGIPSDKRHGYHLYANETRVPLIMHIPGMAPQVVATPVGHIDIAPTLLDALGVHAADEPTLLGQSRLGLMTGAVPDDKKGAIFQEVTYEGPSSRYNGTQKRAIATSEWHYLRNLIPDGTSELYRRSDDPLEEHDRAGTGEPAEAELSSLLAAWMDLIALPPDFSRRVAGNVATTPFAPRQPLGDVLAGALVVDGVDLPAATVRPGEPLEIDLYLHAKSRLAPGWRLFMHVEGGGRMINADHDPIENLYSLSRLRPGTFLRDRVHITLPPGFPRGPVRVRVGLFRGIERAPVAGAHGTPDHAVDLGTLTVQP